MLCATYCPQPPWQSGFYTQARHLVCYAPRREAILAHPTLCVKLDGAVGAHNGLIIDDLDPSFFGNELYVAGSMGIRKFVRLEVSRPAPLIGK